MTKVTHSFLDRGVLARDAQNAAARLALIRLRGTSFRRFSDGLGVRLDAIDGPGPRVWPGGDDCVG